MVSEHTAGPWRTGTHWWSQFVYTTGEDPIQIASCEGGTVPQAERLANARLVAAAPTMLAALRAVQSLLQFNEQTQRFDFDGERVEHRERLKAVLIQVGDAIHSAGQEGAP